MRTHPRAWLSALVCLLVLCTGLFPAVSSATAQTSFSYWVSMRGVAAEAQPSFVPLSPVATATYTVAFTGCHGRTWYLQPAGSDNVLAARAAGETVQIHRGSAGSSPSGSVVICLIQADS